MGGGIRQAQPWPIVLLPPSTATLRAPNNVLMKSRSARGPGPIAACVTEAANHTVCRSQAFDFEHGAFARSVRQIEPLGDDAVMRMLPLALATFGHPDIAAA